MSDKTVVKDCKVCEKEKIDYGTWDTIFIHYEDGSTMKIEDVMFCDLHGIIETDGGKQN